ncbi:MAG: hypothetical protein M5U18_13165 [Dehalococcoidia bacterium]|nr:hypothetical protein [Dehalococcoidia bacterium]
MVVVAGVDQNFAAGGHLAGGDGAADGDAIDGLGALPSRRMEAVKGVESKLTMEPLRTAMGGS